jgi:hypothetical protein
MPSPVSQSVANELANIGKFLLQKPPVHIKRMLLDFVEHDDNRRIAPKL